MLMRCAAILLFLMFMIVSFEALLGSTRAGNHTLDGIENAIGSPSSDVIIGDLGPNMLYGGFGDDQLRGGAGDDNLFGEAGSDQLLGEDGDDTMTGSEGADSFHGGAPTPPDDDEKDRATDYIQETDSSCADAMGC